MGVSLEIGQEEANTHGTKKEFHFGMKKRKLGPNVSPEYYSESNKDRCYCFRIRSKFDDKRKLIEAYYGKIYGDFQFEGSFKGGFSGIDFLYYLNPTPLGRNLEWDMKNNLCPKPGKVGRQP